MGKPELKGHKGQQEREINLRRRRKYLSGISKKRNRAARYG